MSQGIYKSEIDWIAELAGYTGARRVARAVELLLAAKYYRTETGYQKSTSALTVHYYHGEIDKLEHQNGGIPQPEWHSFIPATTASGKYFPLTLLTQLAKDARAVANNHSTKWPLRYLEEAVIIDEARDKIKALRKELGYSSACPDADLTD